MLITIAALFAVTLSKAQSLKVIYAEKMDLSESLKGIDDPMIKQMVLEKTGKPKYFELIACNGVSIYRKKEEPEANGSDNVIVYGEENIVYKNRKNKEFVKQTDFMSRTFLIEDKLEKYDWKITEETEKIGNYLCRKASLTQGKNNIKVWFTDEISSNEGPQDYYGLPGLILKVKTNSLTIEATNIKFLQEKTKITKPSKGKKVSRAEFKKIQEEKTKNLTGGKKENGIQIIKL